MRTQVLGRGRTVLVSILLGLVLGSSCGGGGGEQNPDPGPVFLAAQRYFPSTPGTRYIYRVIFPSSPPGPEDTQFIYDVVSNPLGGGVYYDLKFSDEAGATDGRGPVFDGLNFAGMLEDKDGQTLSKFVLGTTDTAQVLPPVLSGLGQEWPMEVHLGADSVPFIFSVQTSGTARLAAVEDVTVDGVTFPDCLRIDVSFGLSSITDNIALASGSYWLAPDFGPVQGIMRVMGAETARVELFSSKLF